MDKVKLADALKTFAEAYGAAVRAGVLTPNLNDEEAVRKMFGLPEASAEVRAEWSRTKGVRLPITLSKDLGSEAAATGAQPAEPSKTD